jgi:hypothetical protein
MATQQKILEPETRAKLAFVGIAIVMVMLVVAASIAEDRLGLRGTISGTTASIEPR